MQGLQQGIPHLRGENAEKFAEVAFAGDNMLTLDPDGAPPLLIAHGLGDSAMVGKIMDHTACCRMMTPAVPVAIEICSGSSDGEDHKLTAIKAMGTVKGGRASSTTKRVPVLQAACGEQHTIMLTVADEKRAVRVCGDNTYGQLGLGHRQPFILTTRAVPLFSQPKLSPVASVAAGADFSVALLQDGTVFSWGNNRAGQLGLGLLGATFKPLAGGNSFVEISELLSGGALARTEEVSQTHRVTSFKSRISASSKLHQVGQAECTDESNPLLGILGLIEQELGAFRRLEQQQMTGMRRRKEALERVLQARTEAAMARDHEVTRAVRDIDDACERACNAARKRCEQDIRRMSEAWGAEEQRRRDALLAPLLLVRSHADIAINAAHCVAASIWRGADIPKGPLQAVQARGDVNAAADKTETALDWQGFLKVEVIGATNLPKMDLLGKCDAFVQVLFLGDEHKTGVKMKDLNPEWRKHFVFRLQGEDSPQNYARRETNAASLVLKVWDWDRWTSHDLVGTVEVTQDKVLEVLGKQDGHETHMDLAILDSCCPPMPVLDKKKRSSTLHLCLSTLRQEVKKGTSAAGDDAAEAGGARGRAAPARNTKPVVLETPEVKVQVVRCCDWLGAPNARLSAHFLLQQKLQGNQFAVLAEGKGALPNDSFDSVLSSPAFIFPAGCNIAATVGEDADSNKGSEEGEGGQDKAGTSKDADDGQTAERLMLARSLYLSVHVRKDGYADQDTVGFDRISLAEVLSTDQQELDQRKCGDVGAGESEAGGAKEGGAGGKAKEEEDVEDEHDKEQAAQSKRQALCVSWEVLVARLLGLWRLGSTDEREAAGRACSECREESTSLQDNTRLVWLHVRESATRVAIKVQVRVTFSCTLPLNGYRNMCLERAKKVREARRQLKLDLWSAAKTHEVVVRSIRDEARLQSADLAHTMFIKGQMLHGVGLVLAPAPDKEDGGYVVERLVPSSPAQLCGQICCGDVLVSIDGVGLTAVDESGALPPLLDVESRLIGREGTKVMLRLLKAISKLPFEVSLARYGGLRIEFLMRWFRGQIEKDVKEIEDKYEEAINVTRRRIVLKQQQVGAVSLEELKAQRDRDTDAAVTKGERQVHALQAVLAEKARAIEDEHSKLLETADVRQREQAEALRERSDDLLVSLLAAQQHVLDTAAQQSEGLIDREEIVKESGLRKLRKRQREEFPQHHASIQKRRREYEEQIEKLRADATSEKHKAPEERHRTKDQGNKEGTAGTLATGRWWGLPDMGEPSICSCGCEWCEGPRKQAECDARDKSLEGMASADMRREIVRLNEALAHAIDVGVSACTVRLQTNGVFAPVRDFEVEVAARAPSCVPTPAQISSVYAMSNGLGVREVACGYDHAMAIVNAENATAGTLWAWGGNGRGQLGLGDTDARYMPQQVPLTELPPNTRLQAKGSVSCGNAYTMLIAALPCANDKHQTLVLGWGRNERDQLGLNHASEIRSWLFAHVAGATAVQTVLEANNIRNWHQLRSISTKKMKALLSAIGKPSSESVEQELERFEDARARIPQLFAANTRRKQGNLHWLYSAHDHHGMVQVPQGVFVGRDGKVFLTNGLDGPACQCRVDSSAANSSLVCQAHGEPLGWTRQLGNLLVYPPTERWVSPGADHESTPAAKEGDMVRIGVYPQDPGLHDGNEATIGAALKNVPDGGAQLGDNYVQRQIDQLYQMFDDPLSTCTVSFHYDGAIHFPVFSPGRQIVHRILCGDECTAVTLRLGVVLRRADSEEIHSNGENRFLGNIVGAMQRLQTRRPMNAPRPASVAREIVREAPYVKKETTALHMGILGVTIEKVISKQPVKEHLLVRARRGAQKPRALMRITFAQLQRCAFPYHGQTVEETLILPAPSATNTFRVGMRVRFEGLRKFQEYNHAVGTIIKKELGGKLRVVLEDNGKELCVKSENLRRIMP